jgi:peptidoglycan/xylan/chitin deacetylase (PgdA/CDA1 family)
MPLSILIYHRVLPQPDPIFPGEVDASTFERHLLLLASYFKLMPLRDAIKALQRLTLPARAACITFDDGYADNFDIALPILQRHNAHATFFVSTAFLDGGRMWNDTIIESVRNAPGRSLDLSRLGYGCFEISDPSQRRAAIATLIAKLKYLPLDIREAEANRISSCLGVRLPSDLMMTSDQLRGLHSAGMEIGGHTVNHPILSRMGPDNALREISHGKETIEGKIGARVNLFAYPNGKPGDDYLREHVAMVRKIGFEGAVSTAWGAARTGADLHQLPRFTPWDKGKARFTLRMVQNILRTPQVA